MAEAGETDRKTHAPTQKRLRDARRRGEVLHSREWLSAALLGGWIAALATIGPVAVSRIRGLAESVLAAAVAPSPSLIAQVLQNALLVTALSLSSLLTSLALVGVLANLAQSGAVFSTAKLKLDFARLGSAQGLRRVLSRENWVEFARSLIKLVLLTAIIGVVTWRLMPNLNTVGLNGASAVLNLIFTSLRTLGMAALVLSVAVGVLDLVYQRQSLLRRLRMTDEEAKRERKEMEGDARIKSHRQGLHKEWANRNAVEDAAAATAVVVNPTHVAVAISYQPDIEPIPIVTAKGQGALASQIRESAEAADVPIVQNVSLARSLFDQAEVGAAIPEDLFIAVAEVIVWAASIRAQQL